MRKSPILLVALIYCIFFPHSAYGDIGQRDEFQQLYSCHSLSVGKGLGNSQVTSILEDENGFIWIGTRTGVDRFNGKTVKQYSLYENDIIAEGRLQFYILQDAKGNIWACASSGKIYQYNTLFDCFELQADLAKLSGKYLFINHVYIDGQGTFWISESLALYRYNAKEGIETILEGIQTNSALEYKGNIYAATIKGVYKYDLSTKEKQLLFAGPHVLTLYLDRQDLSIGQQRALLLIGTFDAGIYVYDLNRSVLRHTQAIASLPHYPCRSIIEYADSTLLVGFDGKGVYQVNRNGREVRHVLYSEQPRGLLEDNGVYCIYNDRAGNLWIGTYGSGVHYFVPKRFPYQHVCHVENNPNSLCNNNVNRILEDEEGNLWFATNSGISVLKKRTGKWHRFFEGQIFLTLCNDKKGHIWAGGYGCGLYRINIQDEGYQWYSQKKNQVLSTDYIYSIVCDPDGELWLGGIYGALMRYNPQTGACVYYDEIELLNSLEVVNADTIAAATHTGFYLVEKSTGKVSHFFYDLTDAGVNSNVFVQSMTFAPGGRVWLSTNGGGLNLFDLKTQKAINYSTRDGLPSNEVHGTLLDEKGRLWIATSKGLAYIVDGGKENAKIFRIGLFDPDIKDISRFSFSKLNNGIFAHGSAGGAFLFRASDIENKPYAAPLYFASFEMIKNARHQSPERARQYTAMLNTGKVLDLAYDENAFVISFASVNFANQEDILYSYKMEGMDEVWSLPDRVQQIRYTNIPPGDYNFTVKGISQNTGNVLDTRSLHIRIAQPYWNTPYAWFVYGLLMLGFVWFTWRYFANRIARKHFAEKIDFFVNTAHDIRTPITLIMAPLSELKREKGLSEQGNNFLNIAIRNTDRLFRLINQLLDFQKFDNSKSLHVMKYDLTDYLHTKYLEFQPLCEKKGLSFSLETKEVPVYLWYDKEKMNKILDNLLSNAVKYTPEGGSVKIRLTESEKNVQIEVEDTGIGIPQKARKHLFSNFYRASNAINSKETGSGLGLLLTQRLVHMHKGNISYVSTENKGTVFRVVLKKGFVHLAKYIAPQRLDTDMDKEYPAISRPDETFSTEPENKAHKTLLLIDDNDELRFYLTTVFKEEYHVIGFPDSESALAYLDKQSADMIISDVMLPGMQGDELCKKLKSDFTTSHIPVILLTARTEKDAIIQGLESGADDYLIKPFDTDVLKMKLKSILLNRQAMYRNILAQSSANETSEKNAEEIPLTPKDQEFLKKSALYIKEHMSNAEFNVAELCREFAMSRTLYYGKLKSLTGQSPIEFIRTIRLAEAAKLLHQQIPVQEVAERVGFMDTKYFSTVFKKHYGVSPSKYE